MAFDDTLAGWADTLSQTSLAVALTDSNWLFGVVEAVHVIALTTVLGSIGLIDLRVLGLTGRGRDPEPLLRVLLPVTWGAFVVAAITGTTMIFANPQGYFANFFFRGKLVLLLLAGINVLVFHRFARPGAQAGRVSAGISLALWLTIVTFGRWIGFTI